MEPSEDDMKTTTTVKRAFMQTLYVARVAALVALVAAFGPTLAGCIGGWFYDNIPEGDRCNPYDSHNECASGLACTVSSWQVANAGKVSPQGNLVPALGSGAGPVQMFCPENYCCPVDSNGNLTTSSNPNCQEGCNGGAAASCAATGDPDTCAFAAGMPLPEAGDDGGAPAEASTSVEGGGGG
jgi:hypothetical protein